MRPVSRQPVKGSGRYPQPGNRGFRSGPQPGHSFPVAASGVAAIRSILRPQAPQEWGRGEE